MDLTNHERAGAHRAQFCKYWLKILFTGGVKKVKLYSEFFSSRLHLFREGLSVRSAGLISKPAIFAAGTTSCSNSNCFAPSSTCNKLTPVRLPPGRLRLVTNLRATGSPFTKYHTINFPATEQVRYYYANSAAVAAAKAGRPLPDGSVLFAEVYAAKLDADNKPITGGDGFYVADKLLLYTAMAREEGWGKDIPEKLRNENWNYAIFTTDKQHGRV